MSAPGKLVRSSRWKTGPSKGQRPLGSECCVVTGDASEPGLAHRAGTLTKTRLGHERLESDFDGA
jgi:hypothetical protein